MARQTQTASKIRETLRTIAMRLPEVEEGITCDKAAFKARGKAFLFVGSDERSYNVMVKLRDSLANAAEFAGNEPASYKVGGHDWVTLNFPNDKAPPAGLMERWIEESYRLLAPKQLVALLVGGEQPTRGPTNQAQRATPKKTAKRKSK